jgi:hypothetical protein
MMIKSLIQQGFNAFGYQVLKVDDKRLRPVLLPLEFTSAEKDLINHIVKNNLSMVSLPRLIATANSVKYAIINDIEGDFVECGVWRGGNSILAAGLISIYGSDKAVYLFDTFKGMTPPTEDDFKIKSGKSAKIKHTELQRDNYNAWCYADLQDVMHNFEHLGLSKNIYYIQGDVRETLSVPDNLPKKISVLRLDTDWFDSSYAELKTLYPLLSGGGVLMLDDYGKWSGAKKAADTYFDEINEKSCFYFIDEAGRFHIKRFDFK